MAKSAPIELDQAQANANQHLEALEKTLNAPKPSVLRRAFSGISTPPKGIYIWGQVGRGKTMLMDQFYAKAKTQPKRRIHFHAFMQEVHQARAKSKADDIISDLASKIAKSAKLLCLDEMQVTDIADAMILGRLFEALLAKEVVIVTTSNAAPDQLYRDGLNRQLFVPFIEKLKAAFDVIHLGDGQDYRLGRIAEHDTYLTPLNKAAQAKFNQIWAELNDNEKGHPQQIEVLGRNLLVPSASHACARFTFAELCGQPLGTADYLALAREFSTIFVENIHVLKASERNETKRFILAVDSFYDCHTRLVILAEAQPEALCPLGQHKAEFARTASRLREMQSKTWWATKN